MATFIARFLFLLIPRFITAHAVLIKNQAGKTVWMVIESPEHVHPEYRHRVRTAKSLLLFGFVIPLSKST